LLTHSNVRLRTVAPFALIAQMVAVACGGEEVAGLDASTPDAGPAQEDARPVHQDDAQPRGDAQPPNDAAAQDAQAQPGDAGATACQGLPGTFHDQPFMSGGQSRGYFLHVPAAYRCDESPWPILVDFHGTAGGLLPEEAYQLDALIATAEAERFITVRPRSRSSLEGGEQIFRWDQNPGDLPRNATFAAELLADLQSKYNIDPARIYAAGFSSGTNMIAQLLRDPTAAYAGYGFVAGGYWDDPGTLSAKALSARYYLATGYRDYLWASQSALVNRLETARVPAAQRFVRETKGGHELYDWHFPELWKWLDRGERALSSGLEPGWTQTATVPGQQTLLAVARNGRGELIATGVDGRVFKDGTVAGQHTQNVPLVTIAALAGDRMLAAGDGALFESDDGGDSWRVGAGIPEPFGAVFGVTKVTGFGARGRRVIGAGTWNSVISDDGGAHWAGSRMFYQGTTSSAQVAAVAIGTASVAVAAGYYWLGRSGDGLTFTQLAPPREVGWLNDVAYGGAGQWWVAGDHGAIFHSNDDGASWVDQSPPGEGRNLYAIDMLDANVGFAVGAGCAAFETLDAGLTWRDVSCGLDAMLADVMMVDARRAIVVAEGGRVLEKVLGP